MSQSLVFLINSLLRLICIGFRLQQPSYVFLFLEGVKAAVSDETHEKIRIILKVYDHEFHPITALNNGH